MKGSPVAFRSALLCLLVAACGEDPPPLAPAGPSGSSLVPGLQADGAIHVSTRGSDGGPGTASQPYRSLQRAVDAASPGKTILVHGGTYDGVVVITKSGRPGLPITIRPAGDGPVTVRASFSRVACGATSPTRDRTLQFVNGVDYWRVERLAIVNGVLIQGSRTNLPESTYRNRNLPGRGVRDREAARRTLSQLGMDPAQGIQILLNRITGRGIQTMAAQDLWIDSNEIAYVDCGIGAAIWLNAFTDGSLVRFNWIHHMAESDRHWMMEGIRLGRASSYNVVEGNTVTDLPGDSRGIASDVNSSWNVIRYNRVARAFIGFNEQAGGGGNEWAQNVAESNRAFGFAIFSQGYSLSRPNDRVPAKLHVFCNRSFNEPAGLRIGYVQDSRFEWNGVGRVKVGPGVSGAWRAVGNSWDWRPAPPPEDVRFGPTGC